MSSQEIGFQISHVMINIDQPIKLYKIFISEIDEIDTNSRFSIRHSSRKNDKEKIMTVSPWPFDAVVPMSCIPIDGATNITVPVPFHILGIGASLSIFRKPLVEFIKEN